MIKASGCGAIVFGILVFALCIAYVLAAPAIEAWAIELPVVGEWVMDVMQQVVYFPYAQYVFLLLGVFAIFWGFSLIQKQSWARIVGAVLNGLGAFYILALLIVVAPLDEVTRVRWWIVLIGTLIVAYFSYMAYNLLRSETQRAFAKRFYHPDDVDLPQSKESQRVAKPAASSPQDQTAPELARLIPAEEGREAFIIRERLVTIGRERSHLVLDLQDTSISRQHATICLDGGQFVLEDRSRNGTTVNGKRIKNDKTVLTDGAEILFGRQAAFVFKCTPSKQPGHQVSVSQAQIAEDPTKATPPSVLARLEALWSQGTSFDIAKSKVVIGRDPAVCDLALPPQEDLTVSSRHAEIVNTGPGAFILRDLVSANGTYVDDKRIVEIELVDGMEIRLGTKDTRFRFKKD